MTSLTWDKEEDDVFWWQDHRPLTQINMTSLTWVKEEDDGDKDLHAAVDLEVFCSAFL